MSPRTGSSRTGRGVRTASRQLVLAVAAAAGALLCWPHVTSLVDVAPVAEGQPASVSVVYDPPLMLLTWVLAVLAGVLLVTGGSGLLRHRRHRAALADHTPQGYGRGYGNH